MVCFINLETLGAVKLQKLVKTKERGIFGTSIQTSMMELKA